VSGRAGARYEHVAFDLDGTLIDSTADLAAAVNHALRGVGRRELPAATLAGYVGEGARVLVQRAVGESDGADVERALALFLEHYGAHLLDHTRPHPGVVEALDALGGAGVALSVLTNKPERLSRAILAGLGLLPRFVAVVGGDTLPTRKPDPAGLRHLAALTGTAPARMLLVGDSPIDVRTAAAGGIAFCGVAWGVVPGALAAAAPAHVVATPAELLALVRPAG
jgi:phosphoglycolate phosphatase